MISFCAVVRWDGGPVHVEEVERLAEALPAHLADDRAALAFTGGAVALRSRAVEAGRSVADGLFEDRAARRVLFGDLRLYERGGDGDSDGGAAPALERLNERLRRVGTDAVRELVGDFALCAWDLDRRELLLARDHFGLCPLYYCEVPGGAAVASDLRWLLALPELDREVDPEMALDFLLNDFSHHGRTFLRHIHQVVPAHWVRLTERGAERRRYWAPPEGVDRRPRWEDHLDEWRLRFRTAVRDRIAGSAFPVAAHLSGGLDSGAIVGAAHEIYAAPAARLLPPLVTLSAHYPGLACDEGPLIEEMSRRAPRFEGRRWNGADPAERGRDRVVPAFPGLRSLPAGGSWRDIDLVAEVGARVLLTGTGGDEVGLAWGALRDMAAHARLAAFVSEVRRARSRAQVRDYLLEGLKGLLPGPVLDRVRRKRRVRQSPPSWLGPDLRRLFPGSPEERSLLPWKGSHVQAGLWHALTSASVAAGISVDVLAGREVGAEVRLPYLDVRLVEMVLRIPWWDRFPRGDYRRLQREAASAFLPSIVLRRRKMTFESVITHLTRLRLPALEELLFDGRWRSAPFIDQGEARRGFQELRARDPGCARWQEWRPLWRIAAFETWLDAVMDYDRPRRNG